jgi:hypothetical protein
MASKPKAGRAKKRTAKAAPPKTSKEKSQRERFIEAARDIGVDETGEAFEKAVARIVPTRR